MQADELFVQAPRLRRRHVIQQHERPGCYELDRNGRAVLTEENEQRAVMVRLVKRPLKPKRAGPRALSSEHGVGKVSMETKGKPVGIAIRVNDLSERIEKWLNNGFRLADEKTEKLKETLEELENKVETEAVAVQSLREENALRKCEPVDIAMLRMELDRRREETKEDAPFWEAKECLDEDFNERWIETARRLDGGVLGDPSEAAIQLGYAIAAQGASEAKFDGSLVRNARPDEGWREDETFAKFHFGPSVTDNKKSKFFAVLKAKGLMEVVA